MLAFTFEDIFRDFKLLFGCENLSSVTVLYIIFSGGDKNHLAR